MAIVHAAAQVVAQATQTPLPSPSVMRELVTKDVVVTPQTPAYVLQFFQTLALAATAVFLSIVHALSERGKWSSLTNRLVVTTYTLLAALGTWFLTNHVGVSTNQLQILLNDWLVALGAALGSYNLVFKSLLQAFGFNSSDNTGAALGQQTVQGQG